MYTRDGKKVSGFADAVVPTVEEKAIEEQTSDISSDDGSRWEDATSAQSSQPHGSPQAQVAGGELYGAPADASKSPQDDDEPPRDRSGVVDADEQERAAPGARATLRKNLASKTWTLPTPTPKVDPQGFEDPISDQFWNHVWNACAVHNVSGVLHTTSREFISSLDRDLSESISRYP